MQYILVLNDGYFFGSFFQIMKEHVFNMKDPIIVGMEVLEGNLRVGTPLCIPAMGGMEIGRVASIEQVCRQHTRVSSHSNVVDVVSGGGGGGGGIVVVAAVAVVGDVMSRCCLLSVFVSGIISCCVRYDCLPRA